MAQNDFMPELDRFQNLLGYNDIYGQHCLVLVGDPYLYTHKLGSHIEFHDLIKLLW